LRAECSEVEHALVALVTELRGRDAGGVVRRRTRTVRGAGGGNSAGDGVGEQSLVSVELRATGRTDISRGQRVEASVVAGHAVAAQDTEASVDDAPELKAPQAACRAHDAKAPRWAAVGILSPHVQQLLGSRHDGAQAHVRAAVASRWIVRRRADRDHATGGQRGGRDH
jgi:hypothetical protein